MMANRVPRYESHIRPMIRKLDRDKMLPKFDLWDYDQITLPTNLSKISDRINRPLTAPVHGEMPPSDYGGPWPLEWIQLFNRWVTEECPRLEMVSSNVTFSFAQINTAFSTLEANGMNPGLGYRVWFEPEFASLDERRFSLFREPPETPPPFGTTNFRATIDFSHANVNMVFVNGIAIPIQTSPNRLDVA